MVGEMRDGEEGHVDTKTELQLQYWLRSILFNYSNLEHVKPGDSTTKSAVLMHECGACSELARLHECTDLARLGAAVRVRS